jgi:hypothetical protein
VVIGVGAKVGTGLVRGASVNANCDVPTTTQLGAGCIMFRYVDSTHVAMYANAGGAIKSISHTIA